MKQLSRGRLSFGMLAYCIAFSIVFSRSTPAADVAETYTDDPLPHAAQTDMRMGGVLAESFQYHRQGPGTFVPHATIAPPNGWYGYGFPVQTYRWGWFGAGRYYPHVFCHRNYYGDCCRWAHRYGY
jgi:hypothetical protein